MIKILSILGLPSCRRATYTNHGKIKIADFPITHTDEQIESELNITAEDVSNKNTYVLDLESSNIPKMRAMASKNLSVCITCHEAYIPILKRQIIAVENQTAKPLEKILALDNCQLPDFVPSDWKVIHGNYGSPNPLRNAAAALSKAEWIVYADADDIMDENYLNGVMGTASVSGPEIAFVYADLCYSNGRNWRTPELFTLDKLRESNYISACSAWRISAIAEAGGWPDTLCYDDYSLALKIANLGYIGLKNPVPICVESHTIAPRRHMGAASGKDFRHKWEQRSFGIVTLLAGREDCFEPWCNWIKNADLPPKTTVYVLDNSGNDGFGSRVREFLATLSINTVYRSHGDPCDVDKTKWERHIHVAKLYNLIVPHVYADYLVMLEDDVVPPLDGLRKLVDAYSFRNHSGGISGIYQSRARSNCIVGAHGKDFWHTLFRHQEVKDGKLHEAGCIAGGFTLWNNGLVQQCKPFRFVLKHDKIPMGWDTNLSIDVRNKEHHLFLHGGVRCEHNLKAGENK